MNLRKESRGRVLQLLLLGGALAFLLFLFSSWAELSAAIRNVKIVSVGTGGVPSNGASYFVSLSADTKVATFESFNTNWAPDQTQINFTDIFVHDETSNTTRKVSVGYNGQPTDERSVDPYITSDGRYITFMSPATNLVPNDTNRIPYVDNGMDVFLFDRVTGVLQRVSLDSLGHQIEGNTGGHITADGNLIIMSTTGRNVLEHDPNDTGFSFVYLRNWRTGAVERITRGLNDAQPNAGMGSFSTSFDGRYTAYTSQATNLAPGDTNGVADVFLYDRVTGTTTLVSKSHNGGAANGESHPAKISEDGRFVVYRSFATNIVNPPTDGESHMFLYDRVTGKNELITVNSDGEMANGFSKEPSVCNGGRYVSFTSDATNLTSIPHNGERQIYIRDRVKGETHLVTYSINGGMGNGRAHRSVLLPDCSAIGLATDATDFISGDTNGVRDLFVAELYYPVDLSTSQLKRTSPADSGAVVTYELVVKNLGTDPVTGAVVIPMPSLTTYQNGSATGGAVFNSTDNQLEWNGTVDGEGMVSMTFAVKFDSGLTDPTLINLVAQVSGDGSTHDVAAPVMLNGISTYLPFAAR